MWRLEHILRSALLLAVLGCTQGLRAQDTITYNEFLRSNFGDQTMWDGVSFRVFGITNTIVESPLAPARTLFCNEGDSVILNTLNFSQGEHHTIHLHGLDVDTRNDGDPMTSFWLEHLQDTTYSFRATHAGTYLYHCHVGDVVHVQLGMYGLIVVKAAGGVHTAWTGGPAYDQDKNWITSEMDRSWHDTIPVHDPDEDTLHIPPYRPDYFLINGKSHQELVHDSIRISAAVGEKVYLRMGNIGFFNNRIVFPPEVDTEVIDSDGRPIPNPFFNDTLYMMPGERYGIMLTPLQEFDGIIGVEYIDMNTDSVWDTEEVPIHVEGMIGIAEAVTSGVQLQYDAVAHTLIMEQLKRPAELRLFDALGRLIVQQRIPTGPSLRLPQMAPGAYVAVLTDAHGDPLATTRFVKDR